MAWLKGKSGTQTIFINTDNVLEIVRYKNGTVKILEAPGCYIEFEKGNLAICTERMAFNQIIESEEEK